jgi:hypothetical protein
VAMANNSRNGHHKSLLKLAMDSKGSTSLVCKHFQLILCRPRRLAVYARSQTVVYGGIQATSRCPTAALKIAAPSVWGNITCPTSRQPNTCALPYGDNAPTVPHEGEGWHG